MYVKNINLLTLRLTLRTSGFFGPLVQKEVASYDVVITS